MNRKALLSLLSAVTVATVIVAPVVSYADKLSDAQSQLDSLQGKSGQTKTTISNLKAQEASLRQQITDIQTQIEQLQTSITNTQADVERRQAEIDKLKQEIVQTQKQIDEQYQFLQQRVRLMYEAGQSTYLQVLFSSTSFSDLMDRIQLLSIIAEQDNKVLNDIRDSKNTLDGQKQQMTSDFAQVQASLKKLQSQQSQQESAQTHENSLLGQVHDKRLSQESELKGENAAMANLRSLIQQLQDSQNNYTGPSGGWTWPVPGHHSVSSGYGWRTWSDGSREFHNGIDIPAPIGTPMVAATSGRVLLAGPATGFGDWIVIESSGGLLEIYGHMYAYEIKVHPGQVVHTGDTIAAVGSNGESTGPHLHFTVATGFDSAGYAVSVNPTKYVG